MLGIRNVSESCAATFQCQAINTYNMVEPVRRNITLKVVSKGKFKVSMEVGWCHGKKNIYPVDTTYVAVARYNIFYPGNNPLP